MMRLLSGLLCILALLHCSYAPPVSVEKDQDSEVKDDLDDYMQNMEYHRYLKEVVQALESDPDFRERLEKADEKDVQSGKIAEQLDFVNHNVRTKLDEIKRREMERLRHLASKQYELTNNLDTHTGKVPTNEHLDHGNPHTFEIEDLKKLIQKTTADLDAADKQRKKQFKEYEMQKEFDKQKNLEAMEEAKKKEYMDKLKEEENAKKHHKPLHHPGSKQQLEEVWEKQDHMDQQPFDPKVFFMMHDVDGNGVWDADEVKALFIKELDKLYGPGGPNKDLHERAEEMERMREHVFKENDKNRDGLIDFNEFMLETQRANFNKDEGWKSLDENQIYTQAEYEEFERRRLEEIRYLQQRGLVDAYGRPVPGAQHQIDQAYQQHQAYQQQAYHQQQVPPQYQGQGQPQYYPQGQAPQGQPIAQGYPQGQVPQQPYQQIPQQGYQGQQQGQGQMQGRGQFQAPPQGQFQAQQPPQSQFQAQQPSQGQQPPQSQPQQPPQNVNVIQGQAPPVQQGQTIQAQAPAQGQGQPPQSQSQAHQSQGQPQQTQGQAQTLQGQAPPAQTQNQVPPSNVGANH